MKSSAALPADRWEAAYLRFETPEQEIQKFIRRLENLGVVEWSRQSQVVELFCGRGNGLHALSRLGFSHVEGVDLSPRLLQEYHGDARCYAADCRHLPLPNQSRDVLIVQGGLHHLPKLPDDLEQTIAEMHRVLKRGGRLVLVEPWLTAFLRLVHLVSGNRFMRHLSPKLDALATMIDYEAETYQAWLAQPDLILGLVRARFAPLRQVFAWGKWSFVGTPL
jgi:ubiquinone/menaquinone biosynthesis C-methylase UbiE